MYWYLNCTLSSHGILVPLWRVCLWIPQAQFQISISTLFFELKSMKKKSNTFEQMLSDFLKTSFQYNSKILEWQKSGYQPSLHEIGLNSLFLKHHLIYSFGYKNSPDTLRNSTNVTLLALVKICCRDEKGRKKKNEKRRGSPTNVFLWSFTATCLDAANL